MKLSYLTEASVAVSRQEVSRVTRAHVASWSVGALVGTLRTFLALVNVHRSEAHAEALARVFRRLRTCPVFDVSFVVLGIVRTIMG